MLSLGADPNYTNGHRNSFALGYYENDAPRRLDLLLDRGADVNAALPDTDSDAAGYTLLLYRTDRGLRYKEAYADALHLLERGADPNRAGADGMTFAKMLMEHRKQFRGGKKAVPEFAALWDWAEKHGIVH